MSANGHLKFQGTNRATFVGTTSNIMFDTTSTSLGIGVTGTDHPSSNLYITGNAYVTSDIGVGGVLTMGTVNVVARHDLEAVTGTGNTTPLTVEFTNPTTSLVASGNVEVGGELTVSGFVGSSGTGALTLPTGTTEQQPTGVAGMIRFNTTVNKLQVYNGTVWQSIGGVSATGGTVTTSGGYRIHTFSTVGTFNLVVINGGEIDYLVVAGGGGGGGSGGSGASGAGGGAGGMLASSTTISASTFAITVGAGGGGAGGNLDDQGTNGSNSSFSTFIATGGGGGGARSSTTTVANGRTGGSGGGEGSQGSSVSNYGSGTSGQGNRGGLNGMPSDGNTSNENASGGGGGADAVGGGGLDSALGGSGSSGDGGVGIQSSISGTSTYYAGGGGGGQAGRNSPYNSLGYAANNSVPETHGARGLCGGGWWRA